MKGKNDLSTSCYGAVKAQDYDLVLLPWGATEPHNYHLPYLTDSILSHAIAVEAAQLAGQQFAVNCMVLPPVNLGSQNPGQRELKFCFHARYETQKAVLTDIVASLSLQGFRRMVLINGHGGNSFKNMIRDLAVDYPDFLIAVSDWYTVVPAAGYFEAPGDHADEMETSVMMYYHPELVHLETAGDGRNKPFALPALKEKVAWIPRDWQQVSTDTGIGDPRKATAEKGKRFAGAVTAKYAQFFAEFAKGSLY